MIGILAFRFFGDALWVSVLAVVLTMVFMVLTRTVHPPAGANPLLMVHNHAGVGGLIQPVLVGVGLMFIAAMNIVPLTDSVSRVSTNRERRRNALRMESRTRREKPRMHPSSRSKALRPKRPWPTP